MLIPIIVLILLVQKPKASLCTLDEPAATPKQWLPDPEFSKATIQDCDFPVIDGSTFTNFNSLPSFSVPTVIKNLTGNWAAFQNWQKQNLLNNFGARNLKSGSEASIVYSGGNAEYVTTLEELLDQMEANNKTTGDNFVFDTTILYSIQELMDDFTIPPLFSEWDSFDLEDEGKMWHMLSLGPSRSGLAFHNHGKTWLAIVHGSKRWFVYPVGYGAPPSISKQYNPAVSAETWLNTIYPLLKDYPKPPIQDNLLPPFDASKGYRPLECVQHAGDIVFLPSMWTHMTINIGETIGIGGQQSLSDEERNRIASAAYSYPQLHSYEVLKDLGLSIFNKEYTEQEQLRTRFPFIHEGVILIRNYDEFKLLQNSTYNTIIVLHYHNDTLMNMNVTDPEFNSNIVVDNWLNVSYNTLSEIEVDMVLFLHPIGEQNCSINDTISHVSSIEIYPGLLDEQVQSFQGDDAIPNHDFNQDPFVICESNALQCHEHQILLWFQVYKVAFGSLQHTSVKSKLEYRRALSFFRRAFEMKPMHPESISMIGELAGLADWMDLMNTTIKKADEIYSQQAGQVSNRTTASLIHKLGNAYLQRGYHEEGIHFFQKSLTYDKQFLPSWRDIAKSYLMEGQEQEAKNTLAEMLQVIDKANYPDDVIKLLQDMKLMSSN